MRYIVTIGEKNFAVEIAGERVSVDGRAVSAELLQVGDTPLRRLLIDAVAHRVSAERGDTAGEWSLHVDGTRFEASVVDERTQAIRAMTQRSAVAQGPKPVRAPMPGMVVRVEVEPGDQVAAGQGIVIIEAMKMENELKAVAAGTVSKVLAVPGAAVEKGAILVEFSAHE